MSIKEQIRAEIERRLSWRITLEARAAYNNILRFLDTLPEQPVKDIAMEWWNKGYREGRKNAHIPARELGLPSSWDFQKEQPVSDHHEIEVEFRGEKVTISREFYRDGERNYSTSEQDDNAIWSALRAWCEKKGITPFELYPKQSEQPVEGLEDN